MRQETGFASSNRRGREGQDGIDELHGAAGTVGGYQPAPERAIGVIKDVFAVAGATSAAKDISDLVNHFGTSLASNTLGNTAMCKAWGGVGA
jgi:hypothetical protein